MGEAMEMITGIAGAIWLPFFALLIIVLLIWSRYRYIVKVFKWLTLVLFAYVITAFLAHPDWGAIARYTFIPHIEWNAAYLATFVGILGTTISPYLFFWQAAQEVEEERAKGRLTAFARRGATASELRAARTDVLTGMAFAGLIMYFIILTTGSTLFASGHRDITTARQAAEALRPLAGDMAYLLFTVGLVGTGMLGVPVLAGSAAYAVAEGMAWRASLDERPKVAIKFYGVLAVSVLAGLALTLAGVSAVRMLFLAAVVNGLLAPPLVIVVTLLTSDRKVMGDCVSSPTLRWLGWITAAVMIAAGVAMLVVI
jgi:Mn2+/Fe2+ NRAMP family transporter